MEFTFTLTQIEFNKAFKLHISQSINKRIGIVMIFIGLLLLVSTNTNFNDINSIIATCITAIILLLISFIFAKVIRCILSNKLYTKNTIISKELTISISNNGLTIKHNVGHSFLTWSGIYKWVNNQDFYLLYTAPNIFYIIPTRVIKDDEDKKLLQYLTRYTSPEV